MKKNRNYILLVFLGAIIILSACISNRQMMDENLQSKKTESVNMGILLTKTMESINSEGNANKDSPSPIQPSPISSTTPTLTITMLPSPQPGSDWISPVDGMQMIFIPAGEFLMGSSEEDMAVLLNTCVEYGYPYDECQEWFADELPQHPVYLDAYWMDQTEVTNEMYVNFLNDYISHHYDEFYSEEYDRDWFDFSDQRITRLSRTEYHAISFFADHPVTDVKWPGAQAYCEWAGKRLPTEAEWEKAARGEAGWIYPWGNEFDCAKGNFNDQTSDDDTIDDGVWEGCDGFVTTAPVGSFPEGASPYGVLDMAGNVEEWTADQYIEDYYQNSPYKNPFQSGDWFDDMTKRGMSWSYGGILFSRTANRNSLPQILWNEDLGFRCVLPLIIDN